MAAEIQNVTNSGFFSAPAIAMKDSHKKPVFIDVGSDFRALSVGVLNHILMKIRVNSSLLKVLLEKHFLYFPHHRPVMPGLNTPAERMQHVMKYVRLGELVAALAKTLEKMAFNELYARGLYSSAGALCKDAPYMSQHSIAALAHALNMPIEVQVIERAKTLSQRIFYNRKDASTTAIELRLQEGLYTVGVSATLRERFITSQSLLVRSVLTPVLDEAAVKEVIDTLPELIAAERKEVDVVFEATYKRLAAMVVAGELTQQQLLDVYVRGITSSNDFSRRGVTRLSHPHSLPDGHEVAFIKELVYGLAEAVSYGERTEGELFTHLDEVQQNQSSHAARV